MSCRLCENNASITLGIIWEEFHTAWIIMLLILCTKVLSICIRCLICVFVVGLACKAIDVVTLKMVELCGRGGAGRDGDVVLADGGWLGAEGLLTAALTELEFKEEIIISPMIFTSDLIIIIIIL